MITRARRCGQTTSRPAPFTSALRAIAGGARGRLRGRRRRGPGLDHRSGPPDTSPYARAKSSVAQKAPGPAHGGGVSQPETAGHCDDGPGEPPLGVADDGTRRPVAATRGPERRWRGRGDASHRIWRDGQPAQPRGITAPVGGAEPRAADPERRALVAQQWPQAAGAMPAAGGVAAEGDRAGARQQEDARRRAERPEVGGLDVGHDADDRGQGGKRALHPPALGSGPDASGRDAERAGTSPSQPQRLDGAADHARQRPGRRSARNFRAAPPTLLVQGHGADPGAADVHPHHPAARQGSRARVPGRHAAHSARDAPGPRPEFEAPAARCSRKGPDLPRRGVCSRDIGG
jgi:hypothetical protein